jgi:single-strand DNA-binding protein
MHRNNLVVLSGRVASDPVARQLPSGSWVVNVEVTTPLADGGASVPVVVLGESVDARAGDEVVVVGHVRRRFFRAGGATQSRTEVIADDVVRRSRTKTVQRLVERAATLLETA